ncbi:unnamed protein product, partial [Phaeothamnion confervicola]
MSLVDITSFSPSRRTLAKEEVAMRLVLHKKALAEATSVLESGRCFQPRVPAVAADAKRHSLRRARIEQIDRQNGILVERILGARSHVATGNWSGGGGGGGFSSYPDFSPGTLNFGWRQREQTRISAENEKIA